MSLSSSKKVQPGVLALSEKTTVTADTFSRQPATLPDQPLVKIRPSRSWMKVDFAELYAYRELLYFFVWRDLKVRYKQTALGAAWAIIQPFMTMVVFSVFLGKLAKVPSDGVPYPLFTFAALVPWSFFANGLTQSASSVVASGNLITKVYFPRLLVPMGRVLAGLPDIGLSFLVLLGLVAMYGGLQWTLSLLWLPLMAVLALLTAFGIGLWLSAL